MISEYDKKRIIELIEEYLEQSGKYPDEEELRHLASVRLGVSISLSDAKELIEEHYKEKLLRWAGEELAKYDFNDLYSAIINVLNALDMLFYETKNPKWVFRSIELMVLFEPIVSIMKAEGLIDVVEAEALLDERKHLIEHPKPFKELMTPEDLDNYMVEVQKGINMLAEYFRGMGDHFKAMVVISTYYPAVGIFRSIREDLEL